MSTDVVETAGKRGRKAMSLDEKIEKAKSDKISAAQSDFVGWLKDHGVTINERTLIVVQKLYPEFLKDPASEAVRAERKAEAEKAKAERISKSQEAFMKRAEKLGFKVEKVEVSAEDAE